MQYKKIIGPNDPSKASDVLADYTGLSKTCIKQAMTRGAVWLQRPRRAMYRLRRATTHVQPGDTLTFYYSQKILDTLPPESRIELDLGRYSIWFKPPGLLTQGTRYGDHCSLMRQVEQHFDMKRKVYLVHRIDREAAGLVTIAHDAKAAARLSDLFRKRRVDKRYTVRVHGDLETSASSGRIDIELDGKTARTTYQTIRYEKERNCTVVRVRIETGRHHQIRRHFEMIGHPVMGDPKYGKANADPAGLQLLADQLMFECPFGNGTITAELDSRAYNF